MAIWERNAETAAAAGEEVGGLGITTDVRESAEVDDALARTVAELGPVSILVNNAGGVFSSPLLETSENGLDALYRANLKHVILCTQRVARHDGRSGQRRQHHERDLDRRGAGRARLRGLRGGQGRGHQLHQDGRPRARPLRHPGERPRPRHHHDRGHGVGGAARRAEERFGLTVPMGRAGHVDEMAGAAVFLAGDLSSYVTGQTIHVDGGTQASSGWYHHPDNGSYVLGPS